MDEIGLYRVTVTKEYTILAVGETEYLAILTAQDVINNGDASFEIENAVESYHAVRLERVSQLGADEREALPWGGCDDAKHCRDYVSP